jgi:hypothetical protein
VLACGQGVRCPMSDVIPTEVLEQRFSIFLFRFHQSFNLLDQNLGLCIRSLENPRKVEDSHEWLANSTVKTKLVKLRQLFVQEGFDSEVFEQWFELADSSRFDRNLFTHAYWEILPLDTDSPVYLSVHPWMASKLGVERSRGMTIDAFEAIAKEMQNTLHEFVKLRRVLNV